MSDSLLRTKKGQVQSQHKVYSFLLKQWRTRSIVTLETQSAFTNSETWNPNQGIKEPPASAVPLAFICCGGIALIWRVMVVVGSEQVYRVRGLLSYRPHSFTYKLLHIHPHVELHFSQLVEIPPIDEQRQVSHREPSLLKNGRGNVTCLAHCFTRFSPDVPIRDARGYSVFKLILLSCVCQYPVRRTSVLFFKQLVSLMHDIPSAMPVPGALSPRA